MAGADGAGVRRAENLRASVLMVASMAGFAFEDMVLKFATALLPVGQVIVVLGVVSAAVFALGIRREGRALVDRGLRARPVVLRNLSEMGAAVCLIGSLAHVPLSTFTTIVQANPLLVTLGGALFLGERVGWRRAAAIGVGFLGVLMIVRPASASFDPWTGVVVLGTVFLSARDLATRAVPAGVSTFQLSAWGVASIVPAGLAALILTGETPVWDGPGMALALGAAAIGVFAYYGITLAMRIGEVAAVAPFRYTRLVFAFILAAAVLGERPDGWTLAGAALVIGSGLYTMLREARLRAQARGAARVAARVAEAAAAGRG